MTRFEDNDEQHLARKIFRQLLMMLGGALVVFAFFFGLFANSLDTEAGDVPAADGIVVFTGTASARISAGLDMLARGKGQRLLISGVYADQNFDTILTMAPDGVDNVSCCLDLDYIAKDTRENAHETALWAEIHGYRSLIIVTSAHHVPRAYLEMRRAMPAIRLSTYPVVPENVRLDAWWRYSGTFALLLGEYVRYIWSLTGLPVFS
jgi:uncharacterized SAM-binding protein YcdF (DUF218 family)